ncbi:MAG: ABC transporter permease [Bacilli bacterium]|nr:ABC transporter permease [Bacilli bacterium]
MLIFSEEHKDYLNAIRREKRIILFWRVILIFIFLLLWEFGAQYEIINTFLFSSPTRIVKTIILLFKREELINNISITIAEVLISFIFATVIGIFIATIMWFKKRFAKIIDPYITIINSLPKVALGPLIIIWVGASINSIVFMAITISVFTTIINIYSGFISVDNDYLVMIKSFGASKWQIYKKIIFPSNLENIITTLKINISLSLIGVIMGELLVSKKGLGYLIMYGSQVFNLDLVISSIFILGFISYVMYLLVDRLLIYIQKKRY